ncbi:MAG: TetR/AcrR family transcriptional regulator [Chitinophagaceae bacterium]|nr:MAG: TetR/AcrR family transcriptional regulator [Chitinophagaceae bacterium]
MDTRSRIVDVASRLFYTQGYNSTGINQVIKEAEVAKASLYQHFPSKEDLLVEYLTVTSDLTRKALQLAIEKQHTPKEKVIAMFDFLLKNVRQNDFTGCNFLNIASEIPTENERVRAIIRNQKDSIRRMFADILKPLRKEELADQLYILFDAALISSKVYRDVWPVKTTKKIVEKLI